MPVGVVSVVYGSRCEVLDEGVPVACHLRGRLRVQGAEPGFLVAGDQVEYTPAGGGTGVVERVLARRNELARSNRDRTRRRGGAVGLRRQVVLANADQVVFVAAARDPGLDFALLDRALALARAAGLPSLVCVNKMDLAPEAEIRRLLRPYEALGISVCYASAATASGLDTLRGRLEGKVSFLWGGSGVGKSSLIAALTGASPRIGRWRTDNPRGPHTTNVTRLYPLAGGGLLADTPGFDWLALDTVHAAPAAGTVLLPEAARWASDCRFPGCSHCGEPGCAVMGAVLAGEVDRDRYARFRAAMAEEAPPARQPLELLAAGDELFFRMYEGSSALWTTFQFHHLFQRERREREGLLRALGVPQEAGEPAWVVFQETATEHFNRRLGNRHYYSAKLTAGEEFAGVGAEGEDGRGALVAGTELLLRERGAVRGFARVLEVAPAVDTWRLRKALKHTPIYDSAAFWYDLKPPAGERVPPLRGAALALGSLVRFDSIPGLALGALTRQGEAWVLDYLEVGASEDELTHA